MNENYKTVLEGGEDEIVEKKSRFIATVRPVATEEEAIAFIEEMKKKYWNATHNCSAFVVGRNPGVQRCSDDGEPSGTAGKPMLDVLMGEKLYDTAVVVTRYFGGTLLGTGGLVRAYSKAVQAGLAASVTVEKQYGAKLELGIDYGGLGKVQYYINSRKYPVLSSDFADQVTIRVLVPAENAQKIKADLVEVTNGQISFGQDEFVYYGNVNGEVLLFES